MATGMHGRRIAIALLLFFLCAIAISTTRCDGATQASQIDAKAFPSGNVLSIQIPAKLPGGSYTAYWGHEFSSEQTFFELQRWLSQDCMKHVIRHAQSEHAAMRLDVMQADGTTDYYLLASVERAETSGRYVFTPMRAWCTGGAGTGGGDYLLLPSYWLDPALWQTADLHVAYDTPYRCGPIEMDGEPCSDVMDAFAEFYCSSGWYQAERTDTQLTLTPKAGAENAAAFCLSFSTSNEKVFVTIHKASSDNT